MLIVFATAFSIPFMTGFFGVTYAQASGTVAILALAYLLYRAVIYRSYKYIRSRTGDSAA